LRAIAKALDRSPNSISEEIKSNSVKGVYTPKKAHHKAYVRRKESKFQGKKIVTHPNLRNFVEEKLLEGRSPESIAGRVTHQEKHVPRISADSIVRFLKSIHGRKIEIERNKLSKKKRSSKRVKKKKLENRIFIDKRPQRIEKRQKVGDTEADFIVSGRSGKGYLLTVADRKLRVTFIEKILPVSIENMEKAFLKIKERFPEVKTVTTDNDILFVHHKRLESLLDVKIYFCHPYHSWEKGSIENVNGEIRKDIPKGSDISLYTAKFIRTVEEKVNDRYMECLSFATPQELLDKHRSRKKHADARKG
jgi:transposase, IS30 family